MFYRQFIPPTTAAQKSGHPRWYGDKFDLKDETTWHEPDEVIQSTFSTKKGRQLMVTISGWKQMLMRGTFNYKMNRHPERNPRHSWTVSEKIILGYPQIT